MIKVIGMAIQLASLLKSQTGSEFAQRESSRCNEIVQLLAIADGILRSRDNLKDTS